MQNNAKQTTLTRICFGYPPWFTLTEPVAVDTTNERELALKYILSPCSFHTAHILRRSLSLSPRFSPKGRILEESLIIFTAHSIIPAKRLIHDLSQWRPTPPSQGEEGANGGRKAASVQKNTYPQWWLLWFWICVWDEIHILLPRRKETCCNDIYMNEDLSYSVSPRHKEILFLLLECLVFSRYADEPSG